MLVAGLIFLAMLAGAAASTDSPGYLCLSTACFNASTTSAHIHPRNTCQRHVSKYDPPAAHFYARRITSSREETVSCIPAIPADQSALPTDQELQDRLRVSLAGRCSSSWMRTSLPACITTAVCLPSLNMLIAVLGTLQRKARCCARRTDSFGAARRCPQARPMPLRPVPVAAPAEAGQCWLLVQQQQAQPQAGSAFGSWWILKTRRPSLRF